MGSLFRGCALKEEIPYLKLFGWPSAADRSAPISSSGKFRFMKGSGIRLVGTEALHISLAESLHQQIPVIGQEPDPVAEDVDVLVRRRTAQI